jgi:acetyl-CoA acetyltransferase
MTKYYEKDVAIVGIGQSKVARPASVSALSLTLDACLEAIQDAGLTAADIDGISCYPGMRDDDSGHSPVLLSEVRHALGVNARWYAAPNTDSPGHMSAFFEAINAIAVGAARHVLVFRSIYEASARLKVKEALVVGKSGRARGLWEYAAPYNALSPATWYALWAARHFHEYGTTSEQFGWIAVNGRRMAALNPNAVYTSPLTLEDYLSSRIIATPLRIYDCDVPIDGSTAFVLSHASAARDTRNVPVRFEAIGTAIPSRSFYRPESFTSFCMEAAASMMWSRTDLRPKHVQVAQIYDGISVLALYWLEALGFCRKGEAGSFLEGGARIALDGELPMNTSGGQLSAGRFHGFGHVHEACIQLWNRGGARQVRGASVCVVSNGNYGNGCMLLTIGS